MKIIYILYCLTVFVFSFLIQLPAFGYDVTDKFSIGGVLAGVYQYQDVKNDKNRGHGAFVFQPEFSFTPTDIDEIFAKFGFAAGNGLNDRTRFNLAPWAADMEDDVENINGRNRDYLLTAWYKHTFQFNRAHSLGLTGAMIDATDYLDGNAYANDEYNQFMNAALVNAPNGFFPSYDIGGALEWVIDNWSLTGVAMSVGENDEGNSFNYYGIQLRYQFKDRPGSGNYRLIIDTTSKDFNNPQGTQEESLLGIIISFDQELGQSLGAWIRFGWQEDKAAIDYQTLYSGGINLSGSLWGRSTDNIGIGYAHLDGGNQNIESSQVFESYYRCVFNDIFSMTLDIQYLKDKIDIEDDPSGFIYGIRMTAEF
jgi:porin